MIIMIIEELLKIVTYTLYFKISHKFRDNIKSSQFFFSALLCKDGVGSKVMVGLKNKLWFQNSAIIFFTDRMLMGNEGRFIESTRDIYELFNTLVYLNRIRSYIRSYI